MLMTIELDSFVFFHPQNDLRLMLPWRDALKILPTVEDVLDLAFDPSCPELVLCKLVR